MDKNYRIALERAALDGGVVGDCFLELMGLVRRLLEADDLYIQSETFMEIKTLHAEYEELKEMILDRIGR